MSEQEPVAPAAPEAPLAPQKRVSGLLVVSILLTMLGFVFVPIIGPVAGLISAFMAKRKIREDPLLVGPRFANFCILLAILAIPANIWLGVIAHDRQQLGVAFAEKYMPVMKALMERDLDTAWEKMDDSYRERVSREAFKAEFAKAIPGTEPIQMTQETLFPREQDIEPGLTDRLEQLRKGDVADLEFVFPWRVKQGEVEADLDMRLWIRRLKWASYEAKVLNLTVVAPAGDSTPDETPGKVPPKDEPEKTDPGENAPEDAPEDEAE